MNPELSAMLETAELAARVGGAVLQSWRGRFTAREKSRANLVTEADLASQQAIVAVIRERYPDHDFLAEEEGAVSRPEASVTWIIDPLDGTTNYVHGFPYYAVSIAAAMYGEIVVGVIFDPTRNELFLATKGRGATLNGNPIRTSTVETLADSLVVGSLPSVVLPNDPPALRFQRVMSRAQSLQRTGSAALNLACVASGRMDGFWSSTLFDWDMAAGVLLVTEAGGRITLLDGQPYRLGQRTVVAASTPKLHAEFLSCLQET